MPRPSSTSGSRGPSLRAAAAIGLFLALAFTAMGVLDRVAFTQRHTLLTANTGRWAYQEWREKQAAARRLAAPPEILFLGDSTMSRDLRPSCIHPRALNLARSGLQGVELPDLTLKLDQLGFSRPRLIVLALLPEQFRQTTSDLAFIRTPRPTLPDLLRQYYDRPNLSQVAFFPGTRVAKYHLDALVARLDRDPSYRVDADGALLYGSGGLAPGAAPRPPGFMSSPPAFLDAARLAPLEAFVRQWEARGTRVVYLYLPLHPDLEPAYAARFAPDLAVYRAAIARLFGPRVIDLREALPASHFFDATHLNAEGAAAFSRELAPRLAPFLAEAAEPSARPPRS